MPTIAASKNATAPESGSAPAGTTATAAAAAGQAAAQGHAGDAGSNGHGGGEHRGWTTPETATAAGSQDGQAGSTTASDSASGITSTAAAGATSNQAAATPAAAMHAVSLQDAIDAVRATVTAAARAGVSQARISLSPENLGGLKISLTQTANGLVARVAADHPEALQTLQQNVGELRRSLESSGLQLLRLDIGTSGEHAAGGSGSSHDSGAAGSGANAAGQTGEASGDADGDAADAGLAGTSMRVELSDGSLINVLA